MKTGEHAGVAAIGLHAVARLLGYQRRRHYVALMAQAGELAMDAIAARSGLVAKHQRLAGPSKAVAQLADRTGLIGDLAQILHRSRTPALRCCDRNPLFVNIQANKSGMLRLARLLCMRLCAGNPA